MSQTWPIRALHSPSAMVNGPGMGQMTQAHLLMLNSEIFLDTIVNEELFFLLTLKSGIISNQLSFRSTSSCTILLEEICKSCQLVTVPFC